MDTLVHRKGNPLTQNQIAIISASIIAAFFSRLSASEITGILGKFGGMAIGSLIIFVVIPYCIGKVFAN